MALFKILKGQEKNLPANKTEGWAYVTTDEGNMYVDVSASKRVRIGAHADKADVATKAEGDTKSIREIYLAKLKQVTSDGTTFSFRGETGNGTNAPDLISIPLAGDKAGLISNAAQTIKGEKTFVNGIKFPDVTSTTYPAKSVGLTWTGSTDGAKIYYEVQASDKGMLIIEATDDTNAGTIFRNSNSGKTVSIVNGVVTGAFTGNLTGTANNAISDNAGKKITSYVYSVTKKSPTIFTVTKGDGTTNDIVLDFLPTAGGTIHGELYADSIISGSLVVTGVARFTNGLLGNLIGNVTGTATNATYAEKAKGDTTSIRSTYIASIKQVTSNGTTFSFRGYAGDGSEKNNLITVPNASTSIAGLVTTGAQTIAGNKTFTGQLIKNGVSTLWVNGRNNALLRMISINGYSPAISIKTTNGSWDIGAYNEPSYTDDLVFSYVTDANYNAGNNTATAQIKFLENGHIVASLDGNASSATKAIQDGLGQNIADTYIKSITYVAHATQPKLKYTKGSGGTTELNMPIASATNAGLITNAAQTIGGIKTFNDNLFFANITGTTTTTGTALRGVYGQIGGNDGWRIAGGASADNAGFLEIAVCDDGTEPIYVRQYNGGGNYNSFVSVARTLTLLDENGNTRIPGSLYDKNNQELRASLFLASLFTKTSTGTQLIIGGKNTAGTELSTITIPNASTSVAGIITNSDQSIKGTKTLDDGMLIIKPVGRNHWTEGIRILAANNGWTTLAMGGSVTSGTNASTWSVHTYQSNFYIAHNGSNSSTTGIFQSDANGNWRIDNSLGIGGKNAAYKLYVNGASYFDSTRDSTYSKDGNASIVTTGGVSIAGRVSANSVKIDNADSDTNTEGCIMKYNSTCKCIEFIFGI